MVNLKNGLVGLVLASTGCAIPVRLEQDRPLQVELIQYEPFQITDLRGLRALKSRSGKATVYQAKKGKVLAPLDAMPDCLPDPAAQKGLIYFPASEKDADYKSKPLPKEKQ
ncbi:MAG: hypothetical protein Q7R56_02650 [Nanoarchaeota archaeon]|nr:hypothetical protein [Nanoarchaeota archaeon]